MPHFVTISKTHLVKTTIVTKAGCSALLSVNLGNENTHHCHGNSFGNVTLELWLRYEFNSGLLIWFYSLTDFRHPGALNKMPLAAGLLATC